jgi:hypothetical protein
MPLLWRNLWSKSLLWRNLLVQESPVVEEPVAEDPAAAVEEPEDEARKAAAKYANMSLQDRALQILVDSGVLEVNNYDSSKDDGYI